MKVTLSCGDQPRAFVFGNAVAPSNSIIVNQNSLPLYSEAIYKSVQAILTGTGAITATIALQGSNDDDTGRGLMIGQFPSLAGPAFPVQITNASATILSPGSQFTQAMVGSVVDVVGVPFATPTTISAVAAGGASATMSAVATGATTPAGTSLQGIFRGVAWASTALGTITLSAATAVVTDGVQLVNSWRYIRAVVTNITGTVTGLRILMGV